MDIGQIRHIGRKKINLKELLSTEKELIIYRPTRRECCDEN
tara:strand:- start:277 stop:399 length:123 start_codon:yes stop_codon:yes gene_type:complete